MTSNRLASNRSRTCGGVSTSNAASSAAFLTFFSLRDSLVFRAAAARSEDSISSRTDQEPQADAEPDEQDKGEAWDENEGRE